MSVPPHDRNNWHWGSRRGLEFLVERGKEAVVISSKKCATRSVETAVLSALMKSSD